MRELLKIFSITPYITKGKVAIYIGMTAIAILFEGFSMAMLYPVMDFIEKGKDFAVVSQTSRMWFIIGEVFTIFKVPKNLLGLMAVVFLLFMMREAFIYWKDRYMAWLTENIGNDIRSTGYKWFSEADIAFYDRYAVGELANSVIGVDGIRASNAILALFSVVSSSLTMLAYVALLLMFSPRLTILSLSIMAAVAYILKSMFSKTTKIGKEVSKYNMTISAGIVERLNGIRPVKLAGREQEETKRIAELSNNIMLNNYHISTIRAKMEFIIGSLVFLAASLIIYFSTEVFNLTLAKIGIFVFILIRMAEHARPTFKTSQSLLGYLGSLTRVKTLLDQARDSHTIKGGSIFNVQLERGVRFERVWFSYGGDDEIVLRNVNIFIPAGKMTALVGRSGAGKSTLVDLIPRLRVPKEGRITFDAVPIEEFDLQALRRSIAFVSQEGFLFNDTIENNIKYCRPEASSRDVRTVAEMAFAEDFIREFPMGFQTMVGERGVRLSGGQRQRIILARALLQGASIIILDEPTSSLDSESESNIQRAMEQIRESQKITMITIAHRLSTIRSADQIIVLDRGSVVEQGSHGELMHEDAWYSDMVKIQMGG